MFLEASSEVMPVQADGRPSPWIFDFKKVILREEFLALYVERFFASLTHKGAFQIAGLEVTALPLLAAIVREGASRGQHINAFFIRKSRKKHGLRNIIEGSVANAPIVLIDDIINSGESFQYQVALLERLKEEGSLKASVCEAVAIIRYRDSDAYANLQKSLTVTSFFSLTDFELTSLNSDTRLLPRVNPYRLLWAKRATKSKLSTGEELLYSQQLLIHEDRLIVGDHYGCCIAYNITTGAVVWEKTSFTKRLDPVIAVVGASQNVITATRDGVVQALAMKDGKRVWKLQTDSNCSSASTSPDGKIIFLGGYSERVRTQGALYAFATESGLKLWESTFEAPLFGGVLYDDNDACVYFGLEDGTLYALDARSGTVISLCKTTLRPRGLPVLDRDSVFFFGTKEDDEERADMVICRRKTLTNCVEKTISSFGFAASGLISQDTLLVPSLDKRIYGINPSSHAVTFETSLGARSFAQPIQHKRGDSSGVFFGTNQGKLFEYSLKEGRFVSVTYVDQRITTMRISEGGLIVIRTSNGDVYTLDTLQ